MGAVFLAPGAVRAAEFRADKSGATNISEAVNDDLYAAGSNVALNAPVSGDAIAAGSTVTFSGTVGKSVLAVGGTVSVIGSVSESVRAIGGNILINGAVGHDVVVLGGQVNIASTASIGGDLVVLGGTVTIDGPVSGNVYVRGGDVTINAALAGSANITARTLSFGSRAAIGGALAYSSSAAAAIPDGAVRGAITYNKTSANDYRAGQGALAAFVALGFFIKIVSLFTLAFIFTASFKRRSHDLVQNAFARFGWDILHGFSALVIIPFAAVVLLVTFIGAPLAVLAIAVYAIMLVLAGILAPVLVGAWLWRLVKKTSDYPVNPYAIAIGVLAYVLAGLVPFAGWIFDFVFMLAALGVLARTALAAVSAAQGNSKHAR